MNIILGILRRPNPVIIDYWDSISYTNTISKVDKFDAVLFNTEYH